MINSTEKVISHKVGLLNLAEELQNVSQACKIMGFSRDTAYSGEDDRHFRGNVTDGFNLLDWKLKRNVSGHDQSTFSVFC